MAAKKTIILIFVVVLVLLTIGLIPHVFSNRRIIIRRLGGESPESVLKTCREMIVRWQDMVPRLVGLRHEPNPTFLVASSDPGFSDYVPPMIRKMNPTSVVVTTNYVHVIVCMPFRRMGILAFREGAEQWGGTEKLCDGLWLWNTTPIEKGRIVNPEYVTMWLRTREWDKSEY